MQEVCLLSRQPEILDNLLNRKKRIRCARAHLPDSVSAKEKWPEASVTFMIAVAVDVHLRLRRPEPAVFGQARQEVTGKAVSDDEGVGDPTLLDGSSHLPFLPEQHRARRQGMLHEIWVQPIFRRKKSLQPQTAGILSIRKPWTILVCWNAKCMSRSPSSSVKGEMVPTNFAPSSVSLTGHHDRSGSKQKLDQQIEFAKKYVFRFQI